MRQSGGGMIFAISPGSEGFGPERYVAYLPFVLAAGANLGPPEDPVTSTQGSFNLKLEKLHHHYALSSGHFLLKVQPLRTSISCGPPFYGCP
jgi:hypothetical protein